MSTPISVPPIGGVGGRTTRYRIPDTQIISLGTVEAGSVLVNESSSKPVFVGDTSVTPDTGVMIAPGNSATWQSTAQAYAISGKPLAPSSTAEEYAVLMVSNVISKIDITSPNPLSFTNEIIFQQTGINGYIDGLTPIPSKYKSLIISQTGVATASQNDFDGSYFFDSPGPTNTGFVNAWALYNTSVLPVTGNYLNWYFMTHNGKVANLTIWGSQLTVPRVQTLYQPGVISINGGAVVATLPIQMGTTSILLMGHRFNLKAILTLSTALDPWTIYPLFTYKILGDPSNADHIVFVGDSVNCIVSSDKKTMMIDAEIVINQPFQTLSYVGPNAPSNGTWEVMITPID